MTRAVAVAVAPPAPAARSSDSPALRPRAWHPLWCASRRRAPIAAYVWVALHRVGYPFELDPGPVIVLRHPWYGTPTGKGSFAQAEAIGDVLRSAATRGARALYPLTDVRTAPTLLYLRVPAPARHSLAWGAGNRGSNPRGNESDRLSQRDLSGRRQLGSDGP